MNELTKELIQHSLDKDYNKASNVFGELIWAGISPNGVMVVDRLENEIIILDLNLNYVYRNRIDFNLYPEI